MICKIIGLLIMLLPLIGLLIMAGLEHGWKFPLQLIGGLLALFVVVSLGALLFFKGCGA